jgi:hypothetical protein
MTFFVDESRPRAVLLCPPNLVLGIIDRSLGATTVERIRRHPLVDAQTVIEFEGTSIPDEPVCIATDLAERQAQLLAPSIVESLQPVRAPVVVH